MIHEPSSLALAVFAFFVLAVLAISFYLGSKAKSAAGYYAAHGEIPWFINGIAFAGDYLSAASFLGICGSIAFYGYDGFLYSIGFLGGWIVALLVVAEPLKRLGKFTFADALDSRFHSQGIRLTAAVSTLVVSIFYLIPQMVGAGALIKPLLGIDAVYGVVLVGVLVIMIVVTAGMVSTTWVQFIKGAMLVLFCTILTVMILNRGLETNPQKYSPACQPYVEHDLATFTKEHATWKQLETVSPWQGKERTYLRFHDPEQDRVHVYLVMSGKEEANVRIAAVQYQSISKEKEKRVNGLPYGKGEKQADFYPVGQVVKLPEGKASTGALGPFSYFDQLQRSTMAVWRTEKPFTDEQGNTVTVYYPKLMTGSELLTPGGSPTFAGIRSENLYAKLDFLSLMLALFAGTASLPHILIRYYTVKDQASARKSTVVGIASIGFFYVLTLYLGLGAMTSGVLDPTETNMAAPLLSRSFGDLPFAIVSAIAFTTVLGTVSGLILAASGAVAHDLATGLFKLQLSDHEKVRVGKIAAVVVGVISIVLGILFGNFSVAFLVAWAFNIAASANLPALVMLLFWSRTTKEGITASIFVGLFSSLAWVLCSSEAYTKVYNWKDATPLVPFNQPAIITLPLTFLVLVIVSLLTQPSKTAK
jgi:cation/acetate symporter